MRELQFYGFKFSTRNFQRISLGYQKGRFVVKYVLLSEGIGSNFALCKFLASKYDSKI